jgi:hypothetical protein
MRKPMFISVVSLVTFGAFCFAQTPPSTQSAPQAVPTPIDIAHASAPLFDDATFHGASDPFVIWNPAKALWFMYYTQRRATLSDAHGVDWVHGSAIGIATSKDGTKWDYVGTCEGDHDLSEPLKATGAGPEPGITWWAPCFLNEAGTRLYEVDRQAQHRSLHQQRWDSLDIRQHLHALLRSRHRSDGVSSQRHVVHGVQG